MATSSVNLTPIKKRVNTVKRHLTLTISDAELIRKNPQISSEKLSKDPEAPENSLMNKLKSKILQNIEEMKAKEQMDI